jgi:glycogen operon protein
MLLMGDEVRRTQSGNNNAYCQDNRLSWFDWDLLSQHGDVHRFVKMLIQVRCHLQAEDAPEMTLTQILAHAHIQWHGVKLHEPDWSYQSHSLAVTSLSQRNNIAMHFIVNAYWEALEFELPALESPWFTGWRRWIDTALPSPEDIRTPAELVPVEQSKYRVAPRSVVALVSDAGPL